MDSELTLLSEYMDFFIDRKANQYQTMDRIIVDNVPPFPKNHQVMGNHPLIELSPSNAPGWGKADVSIHGLEIRCLWKKFEPITFEQFKSSRCIK